MDHIYSAAPFVVNVVHLLDLSPGHSLISFLLFGRASGSPHYTFKPTEILSSLLS